ncbi:uncharacterized protein LOC144168185 isoform X1 [Haemaphysalis longicornis]
MGRQTCGLQRRTLPLGTTAAHAAVENAHLLIWRHVAGGQPRLPALRSRPCRNPARPHRAWSTVPQVCGGEDAAGSTTRGVHLLGQLLWHAGKARERGPAETM